MGTGSFPGVKSGQGVTLTLHPLLVPWSRKSRAITLLLLCAVRPVQSLSAYTKTHFTFFLMAKRMRVEEWCYIAQLSRAYEATRKTPVSPLSPSFTRIM